MKWDCLYQLNFVSGLLEYEPRISTGFLEQAKTLKAMSFLCFNNLFKKHSNKMCHWKDSFVVSLGGVYLDNSTEFGTAGIMGRSREPVTMPDKT